VRVCDVCGGRVPPDNRRFCSWGCRNAALRPKPVHCAYCGVWFTALRWHDGRTRFSGDSNRRMCSDACVRDNYRTNKARKQKISRALQGERHPRWRGGYGRGYRGANWSAVSERARRRAGRRCEDCGVCEADTGELLHVHHLVPFRNFDSAKKANRTSNLRALCRACHTTAEHRVEAAQVSLGLMDTSPRYMRGERHAQAKLSRADVLAIRHRAAAGESLLSISHAYPVRYSTVYNAATGKTWKHLPLEV
jgi:5-methylcytosine-specific restriction endonuclease McrA